MSLRLRSMRLVALCLAVGCGVSAGSGGESGGNAAGGGTPSVGDIVGDGGVQADAPDRGPRLVAGLTVVDVAVFQAVKIAVVHGETQVSSRNAPIVAGRRAVLRAYVKTDTTWRPRPVQGELALDGGGTETLRAACTRTVQGPSSDDDPASVFEFDIPPERVTATLRFSVRVTEAAAPVVAEGTAHPARYPQDGTLSPLGVEASAPTETIVLVPMRYDTDGSKRLPDTSTAQLERYRALLTSIYPLAQATLEVHAPVAWNKPLLRGGDVDFDALNDDTFALKEAESAAHAAYYYALISPAKDLDAYCSGTCTTGQSYLVDDAPSESFRVGAGVGFTGEESAETFVHELGHMHGRQHAPCDVSDPDPKYPYSGGSIGVLGYDPRTSEFLLPSKATDFMGYCDGRWTSDYTFDAIFQRLLAVQALPTKLLAAPAPHRLLRVSSDGALKLGERVELRALPGGHDVPVRFVGRRGAASSRGFFVSRAHGGGGVVLVPEPPSWASAVEVALRGERAWGRLVIDGARHR